MRIARLGVLAAVMGVVFMLSMGRAWAAADDYAWMVEEGNVTQASNGDTLAAHGDGTFNPTTGAASGHGEFVHRAEDGSLVDQGTFEVVRLLDFQPYGPATAEQDRELGPLPPGSEGGVATLAVVGTGQDGQATDAIVQITCELGDAPETAEEGNVIWVPEADLVFDDVLNGDNLFIRGGTPMGHGDEAAEAAPAPAPAAEAAPAMESMDDMATADMATADVATADMVDEGAELAS